MLTERFCQDPVEEYFSNQRKIGQRNDNPDVYSFGYHDKTIRISCQSGNTRGRKDRHRAWVQVTNDPLPSRKKSEEFLRKTIFSPFSVVKLNRNTG